MSEMNECILTPNYRKFMDLQYKLKKARRLFQVQAPDVTAETISEHIRDIQDVASMLTEFEQSYAEWVLDLFERKIDIKEIKERIKAQAAELKEDKIENPWGGWSDEYTKLCALRAAMRGRMHFSPNTRLHLAKFEWDMPIKNFMFNEQTCKYEGILDLEVQKEWVENIVDFYTEEEEEEDVHPAVLPLPPKYQPEPKQQQKPLWRKIASKAKKVINDII